MRMIIFIIILAMGTSACSERSLFGQQILSEADLAKTQIGFVWQDKIDNLDGRSRLVNVLIAHDNKYVVEIKEFGIDDIPSNTIRRSEGVLGIKISEKIRKEIYRLYPPRSKRIISYLPSCPYSFHDNGEWTEYYVTFGAGNDLRIGAIPRNCSSPEAVEARIILEDAFSNIPSANRLRLSR